jgi:cell division inhibitor SepF
MSGFYKKAVVWLGLNEEYPDDVVDGSVPERHEAPMPSAVPSVRNVGPAAAATHRETPRPERLDDDPLRPRRGARDRAEGTVKPIPMENENRVNPVPARQEPSTGTVRVVPMANTAKPQVIVPKSFNDAQHVADMFKDLKPVIVNMQSAERDLARRLIDFSSGLCYGLGGQMEKVAKDVYLLTPDEVEVADEDRVVPHS